MGPILVRVRQVPFVLLGFRLFFHVQEIINFGKDRATALANGEKAPNVGRGVGMAIGLCLITITASVCQHQFFWRSMTTGILARAALISSVYRRGVNLTGKARTKFPNSALVNHISTDVGFWSSHGTIAYN